ncbi:MAG: cupin domain-containing protein [Humidesulfovibrio sp.]|nr:cupin domain-containing protein [Humidesulfovibrio sp.]
MNAEIPPDAPSPHYSITARQSIVETPEVRVTLMTLAPGEATPWHRHTKVTDTAFRLDGEVEVQAEMPPNAQAKGQAEDQTDGPVERIRLMPGVPCRMEPGRVHRVANAGSGPCRFLLVQGVGAYDFVKART